MKSKLEFLLGKYIPYLDVKIILVNTFTIVCFFNWKDTIHVCLRVNIVYSFSCVQSCTSEHIGLIVGEPRDPNKANRTKVRQIAKFGMIEYYKIVINNLI